MVTPLSWQPAQARGGGFGGGGFRGGGDFRGGGEAFRGGGGYHFGGDGERGDLNRGYNGYHPMYGGGVRGSFNNDRINIDDHTNNFYNRSYGGWHENWRGGGYWGSRPWNAGWYRGWGGWGWWGANAAAWGVAGLATGAVIGGLVNAAADQQSPVIVVPDTNLQLNYGTVEAVGSAGVSFNYSVDGANLMGAANCQEGLLNGQVPNTASQAQLLNAVCQVAYGSGS